MNIAPVLHKAPLKSFDEAVTFLISQTVDLKTTRMDKSHVVRRKLKA